MTMEVGSFAPPGSGGADHDAGGDGSDDEGGSSFPADEALAGKMQRPARPPPKKMLKPRALSATIRRVRFFCSPALRHVIYFGHISELFKLLDFILF
jgi:hypothetical protein